MVFWLVGLGLPNGVLTWDGGRGVVLNWQQRGRAALGSQSLFLFPRVRPTTRPATQSGHSLALEFPICKRGDLSPKIPAVLSA